MSGSIPDPSDLPLIPADSEHDCLLRIRQALSGLEGARRRVAECVLASPWEARGLSIDQLADRSGSSENAVTRFARAVGYPGYRAFSQALSVDLGRTLGASHSYPQAIAQNPSTAQDGLVQVVARVFDLELTCIRDTLSNLDELAVHRAISALAEAPRILLIGTGSAAPLCQVAQYRLSNTGLLATWTADPMVMVSEAHLLGPGDVVLAVSHSGQSRATVDVLNYAQRQRRATTICITAVRGSRIVEFADIAFIVFGPNVSVGTGQFSARVSGMVLLEAIATAVAVKRYGQQGPDLHELSEMLSRINDIGRGWKPARLGGNEK